MSSSFPLKARSTDDISADMAVGYEDSGYLKDCRKEGFLLTRTITWDQLFSEKSVSLVLR